MQGRLTQWIDGCPEIAGNAEARLRSDKKRVRRISVR